MFQNIKVDIIYYKTNTDFEMEFNLCGCCRMRLLTDKSPDKKSLIHSLARAVNRSRVIIMIGSLFGDEGIISLATTAIGNSVSTIKAKEYGISDAEEIEIITDSTPLVSPDGFFGGCIIESGPQTMILLTDNKSIRKSVMQSLIHPYIEELCAHELQEKAASALENSESEEISEEALALEKAAAAEALAEQEAADLETSEEPELQNDTDSKEETDEAFENVVVLPQDELPDGEINVDSEPDGDVDESLDTPIIIGQPEANSEDDIILSGNMLFETDDEIISSEEDQDFFIEPTPMKKGDSEGFNYAYGAFLDDENLVSENENDIEPEIKPASFGLPILIIAIIMLFTLAVLCYCIFYVPSLEGVSAIEYIREIFDTLFV